MADNLKLALEANTDYIGSNNDRSTFTFNTGAACSTNGSCIMNGNTVSTEGVSGGGYYYSWYAVTAGTGTSSTTGDAQGSICPQGWILPKNSSNTSFVNLLSEYNLINPSYATMIGSPFNITLPGFYGDGSYQYSNTGGNYWTGTAYSGDRSYDFSVYMSYGVTPSHIQVKSYGFSIRCIGA